MSDVQHMNPDDEQTSSVAYNYSAARLDWFQYHSQKSDDDEIDDDKTVFINDLGIPDGEAEALLASWGYDLKEVKLIAAPPESEPVTVDRPTLEAIPFDISHYINAKSAQSALMKFFELSAPMCGEPSDYNYTAAILDLHNPEAT